MSGSVNEAPATIDRQTTTPFHLKLFYRQHSFHHLSDFPIPSSTDSSGSSVAAPLPLPPHLQIYTWQSCTLRELAQLLTSCLPTLLPDPSVGTRLSFRLVYPDTKSPPGGPGALGDTRGKYLGKDMGSVVIGANNEHNGDSAGKTKLQGADADKTLQDARFVIGDYVDCAILPPLSDGSVAPPIVTRQTAANSTLGGGMRAFGGPPIRENGYGRPRGGGGMGRGSGFYGGGGGPGVPNGEWRRGERIPPGDRGYNGGKGRHRGPY
ncbi:hypothetical protein FQN54_001336 [Arachnomyces sp. PD_36]|nr:hypothetical protein FQN54_001336 [Arachnomyces sp. PD_36]